MTDQRADAGSFTDSSTFDGNESEVLSAVHGVLADLVAHAPGSAAEAFAPECHILDLGVNSIQLMQIHAHLETRLGLTFDKAALFDCETIADLVKHLARLPSHQTPS